MDKKFKWNMFITSFIPLWLSIMVSDIWNIAESGIKTWRHCDSICMNVFNICRENWVCVFVVLVIGILMLTSIISINSVCSLSNLFFRFHTTTLTEACSNELKQHHL